MPAVTGAAQRVLLRRHFVGRVCRHRHPLAQSFCSPAKDRTNCEFCGAERATVESGTSRSCRPRSDMSAVEAFSDLSLQLDDAEPGRKCHCVGSPHGIELVND